MEKCGGGRSGRSGQGGHSESSGAPSTASTQSTGSTLDEVLANGALLLINVASALLDRQVAARAAAFEQDGGFTERLYAARQARRRLT